MRRRNFHTMPSLKIFVLFGVVFGPTIIQGQLCPRTNKEPGKSCAQECVPFLGCSSKNKECICDGDCGYSCVQKDLKCRSPKPRSLTNGKRVVQGRKFNETATFTCDPGFTLSGSSVRTCRGLGTWDGVEPKCGKNCRDPGVGNNTLRREPIRNSGYMTSEVLHYYCIAGYLIEGKDSITCQADGTWDGSPPQCYRTSCLPPTLPANSEVFSPAWFNISQGARNGRKLYLKCNPGYYKVGTSLMTCSGDQWKLPTSFKCSPKNCGNPGVPSNGGKIGLIYHFKSKVTFYCNKCYELVGAAYRVCNADQSWSDQNPTCESVQTQCKDILSIANGRVGLTSTECGGKAVFSCDRYHNLVGSPQIFCNDNGNWSAGTPYCEPVSCPKLNVSKTVHANVSGYQYGSTVKFSCKHANYVLSGNNSVSCKENGEWSADVPECLAPCHVNASDNLISKKTHHHGTKAELECEDGFTLSGTINGKMPVCSNGTWKLETEKFPYCEKNGIIDKSVESFWSAAKNLGRTLG